MRRNINPQKIYVTPTSSFTTFTKLLYLQHDDSVHSYVCSTSKLHGIPVPRKTRRPIGITFTSTRYRPCGIRARIERRGYGSIQRSFKGAASRIHSAKSQIEAQVCPIQHPLTRAIISASDRSIPRVIFQSTVWIVLTIFVPLIAVAFYRDVEAEFKDHLDGQ